MSAITTAEFATELGTDGRTARKFLRSITPREEQPGKGSRWSIDGSKRSLARMRKQFAEWNAAELKARAERTAEAAQKAQDAVVEDEEPTVEETDELDA